MNISGIRPYAGFYDYNSIKASELRSQQIAQNTEDESLQTQTVPFVQEPVEDVSAKQNFTSYVFSKTYEPGKSYELKGEDSDIYNLDTQKAISDLDKDQVLKQYQYFVGDKNQSVVNKGMDPAEKVHRTGENFTL